MNTWTGYRSMIVAALMFVAPALARWGFQVDPVVIADTMIIVAPAIMAGMRAITRTPVGRKSK
jgi:hypothetical protein